MTYKLLIIYTYVYSFFISIWYMALKLISIAHPWIIYAPQTPNITFKVDNNHSRKFNWIMHYFGHSGGATIGVDDLLYFYSEHKLVVSRHDVLDKTSSVCFIDLLNIKYSDGEPFQFNVIDFTHDRGSMLDRLNSMKF